MAHRKAGGSAKNLRDSNPKYLGVKIADGAFAQTGAIIVRQRGTKIVAGKNIGIGKDHTLFALAEGVVKFDTTRKKHFDGKTHVKKRVSVFVKDAAKKTATKPKAKKETAIKKEKKVTKKEA